MRRFLTLLAITGLVIFALPKATYAGVNDFVIDSFHGQYELKNDTPGGRLLVTETIDLTFSDNNHGILRALPKSNRGIDTHLNIVSVQRDGVTEPYTTYSDNNDNLVVKIGRADMTITGAHRYEISYQVSRGVIAFFNDKTEWYWDINGTDWQQPFTKVSGSVIFPAGYDLSKLSKSCYTGLSGSSEQDCTIQQTENGFMFATQSPLGAHQNLSVAIEVPTGSFAPYTWRDWARDNTFQLVGLSFGLVAFIVALRLWLKHGRDYSGKGTIVPEYDPPSGLTPSEVGLIADYQLQGRDISATIIDLAVRGYLTIKDDSKKLLGLFTVHDFSLVLQNNDLKHLKKHEQDLLGLVFGSMTVGEEVKLSAIDRNQAAIKVQQLRKELTDDLTKDNGYFEPAGKRWTTVFIIIGSVFLAAAFFIHLGFGWTSGFIVAAVSFFGFSAVMQRRSHAGVEAYEKAKGLELYMKTAEADRMKMLQSVDRPYAEPSKTFELFEKLLPFAVALGVEKSWAKQFDGLFDKAPNWYQGSAVRSLSAGYIATSLSSGMSSLSQSFSAQSGSSSSGSSGGGSSGGGGGGGGGSGW